MIRNSFQKIFGKYLLLTNIGSSGALLGVGDLVQQEFEYRQKTRETYDYNRAGRMCLVGFCQGPVMHYFYQHLGSFFVQRNLSNITKKILIDQFIASPFFISTFFCGIGLLERKSVQEIKAELHDKFFTVYSTDWCVWPAAQFINFYFINPRYCVMYINLITMNYDVFLSYIKHHRIINRNQSESLKEK